MADNSAPSSPQSTSPTSPAPRKRRKWPFVVGGLLLLLVLLVLLLPTIASTGFVRGIVLGKVNQNLNGRLEIADWDLGWNSGISANGVVLYDESGKILQIDKLSTGLTVLSAVKGNYALGNVVIDGLNASVKIAEDGSNNFQKLVKTTASAASGEMKPKGEASPLPDLSAVVTITNSKATIEKAGLPDKVALDLGGTLKVPGINQPIDDQLTLGVQLGSGQKGTIALTGTADLIENNQFLDAGKMDISQKVALKDIDLASLKPFLPAASIDTVAGSTNGELNLVLAPGKPGSMQGNVTTTGLLVSGPALQGDKFQSQTLALVIPPTQVVTSDAAAGVSIRGEQPVQVTLDHGSVTLLTNASVASLQNLAAGKAPGQPGKVETTVNLDLARLANQLPHVVNLLPGVVIDSGRFGQKGTVDLTADRATVRMTLGTSDIAAHNAQRGNAPINLKAIGLEANAVAQPGKGSVPDLRDFAVKLVSTFASVNVAGLTLAEVKGDAMGDLAKAQQELGQVVDFGALRMGGTFRANLASAGDLSSDNSPVDLNATVSASDLAVGGIKDVQPISERLANVSFKGTLQRSAGSITGVKGMTATVRTGDQNAPVIDVVALADVSMAGGNTTVPSFILQRVFVDLARAQQQYAGLLGATTQPAADKLDVASGTITMTGSGSWDGTTANLANVSVAPANLTLVRIAAGQKQQVLTNYSTQVAVAGVVALKPEATTATLQRLSIDDGGQILTARKLGDAPIQVTLPKQGAAQASGKFDLRANLPALDKLASAFTGSKPQPGSPGEITSGILAGTADLSTAADGIAAAADLTADNLSVRNYLDREKLTLLVRAKAAADLSTASVPQLSLKSSFLHADGAAEVVLKQPAPSTQPTSGLAMVRSADLAVTVPDVPRAMGLVSAVSKQTIVWTAGNAQTHVKLSRDNAGTLVADLQDLSASNLSFRNGNAQYSFDPIKVQTTAALAAGADGAVRDVEVRQLSADLGAAAQVALTQPISIKNLPGLLASLDTATPAAERAKQGAGTAAGAIKASGDLARLKAMIDALGGTPPASTLAGRYELQQKFSTQGQAVTASGDVTVAGLTAASTPQKVFKEDLLKVTSDVTLDRGTDVLGIRAMSVDMQSSKALNVALAGNVRGFSKQRTFDNVTADLSYDAAKLWNLIVPFLSPETQQSVAGYQVSGTQKHRIAVSGSYPADVPFEQAVKQLAVTGSIGVDQFQGAGLTIEKLSPSFTLKDGLFTIVKTDSAAAAAPAPAPGGAQAPATATTINGGSLNLNGLAIELGNPAQRVSAPANLQLVKGANLSAELMGTYGKYLNPLLTNPQQAGGTLDVTIVQCDGVPLAAFSNSEDLDAKPAQPAALAKSGPSAYEAWQRGLNVPQPASGAQPAAVPTGRAEILISITNVRIANELVTALASVAAPNAFNERSLVGNIPNARFIIENGVVRSDLKLDLGSGVAFGFDGDIAIQTKRLNNFAVSIPASTLKFVQQNRQLAQFIPDRVAIPVTGTTQRYQFNADQFVNRLFQDATKKALTGGLLNQLTGSGNREPQQHQAAPQQGAQPQQQPQQGAQPSQQQPEPNPLGDLLNRALEGREKDRDKDRDKKKKRD